MGFREGSDGHRRQRRSLSDCPHAAGGIQRPGAGLSSCPVRRSSGGRSRESADLEVTGSGGRDGDADGDSGMGKASPEKVSRWAHGGRPHPRLWTGISAARSCLCKASAPGVRPEGGAEVQVRGKEGGRLLTQWGASYRASIGRCHVALYDTLPWEARK